MSWLPVVFLLSFGFAQLFKWSQRRGCYAPTVVSVNYLLLAFCLILYYGLRGELHLSQSILQIGFFTGCAFILTMLVMTRALEIAQVGAVLTAFRLGVLLPILTSVWLWGETVLLRQMVGIGLAVISLVLMTRNRRAASLLSGNGHFLVVLLIFLLQGTSQTGLSWVHHVGLDDRRQLVLLVIALTAGLLGAAYVLIRRHPVTRRDLAMGAGIGLFNLICLLVILTALSRIQASVFFPLQGCAVVTMDNLFAHFFWREPLSRPAVAGAVLGAASMLLIL